MYRNCGCVLTIILQFNSALIEEYLVKFGKELIRTICAPESDSPTRNLSSFYFNFSETFYISIATLDETPVIKAQYQR